MLKCSQHPALRLKPAREPPDGGLGRATVQTRRMGQPPAWHVCAGACVLRACCQCMHFHNHA